MAIKTITVGHKEERLSAEVVEREHEIFDYQRNIDKYTLILTALPQGDVPVAIQPFVAKHPNGQYTVHPADIPDALQAQAAEYRHREQIARLLATEKVQQALVQRVYDVLVAQLPPATADTLIQTAATNRATEQAAIKAARLATPKV